MDIFQQPANAVCLFNKNVGAFVKNLRVGFNPEIEIMKEMK